MKLISHYPVPPSKTFLVETHSECCSTTRIVHWGERSGRILSGGMSCRKIETSNVFSLEAEVKRVFEKKDVNLESAAGGLKEDLSNFLASAI